MERIWISWLDRILTSVLCGATIHLHVRNMEEVHQIERTTKPSEPENIRKLFYAVELLAQAYQVKVETLMTIPLFLERALLPSRSRSIAERFTSIGTHVYHHVQQLHQLLLRFGSRPDEDINPCMRPEPNDPIATTYFQEELFCQISSELLSVLEQWGVSDLHSVAEKMLKTCSEESKSHLTVIDETCTQSEKRYRDVVLERFRVTALP